MRVILDPIKISFHNLNSSKFRSFLTMLGIIIGVGSVIIVMSLGSSAQGLVLNQVKTLGSNLIGILPGGAEEKGPPAAALGITITTLKYQDYEALIDKKKVPNLTSVAATVTGTALVKSASETKQENYYGTTASLADIQKFELAEGRFLLPQEDTNLARSVVLGSTAAGDLFPNTDPLGKDIIIKDQVFKVVGVLKKKGSSGFTNVDDLIYLPLFTAQKALLGINYLNSVSAKVDADENVDRAMEDIRATLREQHNITNPIDDDFTVRSTAQALSVLTNITNVLKYFLAGIAAISLVVGGVGIMNIMLVSVRQRIWEIGLRQAVGARKSDIILQFLIESVFVTFSGGSVGIILGGLISFLAAAIIKHLGYDWQFSLPAQSIMLAASIAILIGLIFGMYPARKAGRVSPMEALRYE